LLPEFESSLWNYRSEMSVRVLRVVWFDGGEQAIWEEVVSNGVCVECGGRFFLSRMMDYMVQWDWQLGADDFYMEYVIFYEHRRECHELQRFRTVENVERVNARGQPGWVWMSVGLDRMTTLYHNSVQIQAMFNVLEMELYVAESEDWWAERL